MILLNLSLLIRACWIYRKFSVFDFINIKVIYNKKIINLKLVILISNMVILKSKNYFFGLHILFFVFRKIKD